MTSTISLKRWLARNDSGVWGDDPAGDDDTFVLRSTDIALDGSWNINAPALRALSPSERVSAQLLEGDVVVVKSSGSASHLGKTALVTSPPVPPSACFSNFVQRLRTRAELDPRYLWYFLNCDAAATQIARMSSTTTGLRNISGDILGRLRVPVYGVTTQRAIADYLDRETARIDALVGAKQRMVELLEERVWLAFDALVRASDPTGTRLRRVLRSLIDGPFGSAFTSSDYSEAGAAVIRLGNIGFSRYRGGDEARIPTDLFASFLAYRVVAGDLLIAGLGDDRNHAGRACVAPDLGPAIVKGKCFRGRVDGARADPEFLSLLLSSPMGAAAMNVSGRGSTRAMINLEIVKATEVPLPALEEQEAIVAATRADQERTRRIIDLLAVQVGLLEQRRQALVAAAVTGRLDIPLAA